MSIPLQFYSQQAPMQPVPTMSHHQPTFTPDFHLQFQQQHQLQQQQSLQLQLQQQFQYQQQQQQQHQYHQQLQQHFLQQQQIQQFLLNQQQNYAAFPNNNNSQSPAQYGPLCFVYPQTMSNFILPRNEQPSGENLSSFGSASNLASVLPRDNNNNTSFQIIPKNATLNQFNQGAKSDQLKDHDLSSSQHLNHKEESTKLSCSSSTKATKTKKLLVEMSKSYEQSRAASITTQETMNASANPAQLLDQKKKQKMDNEDDDEIDSISECRENENNCEDDDIPTSERKRVKKEKAATQKAENKKIKEKLLAMSNSAQKELLLQIQQVSKQNSAKAFLKAYKRFALGKQQYIYNYDINENQYYYKVCHDMPLLRIEDPSKKDLEGFYRKFKKFFLGKQYNNNTLKTVVRNKLYGQLFDDFLRTQADEWLEHSKSKNKDDLRIIIKFLLMCHDDPDYLVFLRDHDKSKDVKSAGIISE